MRKDIEAYFEDAPPGTVETFTEHDKGHGRIEQRDIDVIQETGWLSGAATIVRVRTRVQRGQTLHTETRYYISSATLTAARAAAAVRGHWAIENRLHWVLDVTFNEDQSRLRKGFGARNMAVVRHFALNLVRSATDKRSIKLLRKLAAVLIMEKSWVKIGG